MFARSAIIAFSLSLLAHASLPNSVCPDPHWSCPGVGTCCLNPTGGWACCPYAQATCCSDRMHCCPFGMSCSGGSCLHNTNNSTSPSVGQFLAEVAGPIEKKVEDNLI